MHVGNYGGYIFDILWQLFGFSAEPFGWPVGVESGSCECPFEINVDIFGGVDVEHAVTARARPVVPLNWRRIR